MVGSPRLALSLAVLVAVLPAFVAPATIVAESIQQATPPANDNFGAATPVTTLPFSERIDLTAATIEPGEPVETVCIGNPPLIASAWYSYTPAVDGQIQNLLAAHFEGASYAIYTGSSIDALTAIDCGIQGSTAVQAGTTYYIQIAAQNFDKGEIDVILRQPPPPQAAFTFEPSEPNSISPVVFFDRSFDETFEGHTAAWTFGDGATGEFDPVEHQYAADGDYIVGMTITTTDGRTASTQQTISVRTHDVRIKSVSAPKSAKSGQTQSIAVSVVDLRYPETVEVRLFRFDQLGQTFLGSTFLSLEVTTRPTTTSFPYTFTAGDAAAGQVVFLATVDIVGHMDAIPVDNSRVAVTTVKR